MRAAIQLQLETARKFEERTRLFWCRIIPVYYTMSVSLHKRHVVPVDLYSERARSLFYSQPIMGKGILLFRHEGESINSQVYKSYESRAVILITTVARLHRTLSIYRL